MIHDTDASLRSLLRRDALDDDDVEVVFDAPSREWAAKRTSPTVDLFLFDIREDLKRRRVEPERVRDDDGQVIGRRRPPRRFRLSYLVTAWTQRPEDEHRLLSAVVESLLPHEELPRDVLEGRLGEQTLPVFMTVGMPPPPERSIGEIWSAMGGELKPSVEVVLSVPFVVAELRHAGPPVVEEPRFSFTAGDVPDRGPRRGPTPAGGDEDGDLAAAGAARTARPRFVEDGPRDVVRGGTEDGGGRVITVGVKERGDG